jgi:hypothetical protein
MKSDYGNHQKLYLRDLIKQYQGAGDWHPSKDKCWDLLKQDMERDLNRGIVVRRRDINGESNQSYANRCVNCWRRRELHLG